MIKLVLSDMDNTLLPGGQKHVSQRAVAAIRDLIALGVRFGPATGRDTAELERMFPDARDCMATGIVANGKRIYVDGELRHYTPIDRVALARLATIFEDVPNAFLTCLAFDNPRGDEPYWYIGARPGDTAWFEERINFVGRPLEGLPDFELIAATIACTGPQEQLDDLLGRARELVPEFDYVQPMQHWVDVLPAGVNKGTALGVLLDELGITPDEVLFFGDADNDVALMAEAGHAVAVEGASPAALAAARWHIGASADDAVACALEDLAQAIRTGGTPAFMREG